MRLQNHKPYSHGPIHRNFFSTNGPPCGITTKVAGAIRYGNDPYLFSITRFIGNSLNISQFSLDNPGFVDPTTLSSILTYKRFRISGPVFLLSCYTVSGSRYSNLSIRDNGLIVHDCFFLPLNHSNSSRPSNTYCRYLWINILHFWLTVNLHLSSIY